MISALKKFARKNEDGKSRASMPSGVSSMGQSLQRKFGRGVQYNMKIIIKGDRNTGKSTLFGRFQGHRFKEEYIPTSEIQVCSINWNYRVADDVVKVEVWDVVDKGKKKSTGDGLKLVNEFPSAEDQVQGVLDAEFLDVYKGTHGCIMMLDITKQWTFKYVERELPKIPDHIPVLILANFLDMDEHRVVQRDEITEFINSLDRPKGAAIVESGECCMKNSFGLKFIHKFFNIPFLILQKETLEKQLTTNKEDMQATLEELSFHRDSEEQDYEKFLAYMEKRAQEKKPAPPQVLGNDLKSSPASTPSSSTTSLKSPFVPTASSRSSKKSSKSPRGIDDFVPAETLDSGFLEDTDKGHGKNTGSYDDGSEDSEDSGSDAVGNPMVSGFQDISSPEEDGLEEHQGSPVVQPYAGVDVDIEITSDESEKEEVVSPVASTHNHKNNWVNPIDSSDNEDDEPSVTAKLEFQKPDKKSEIVLNDEDSSFMDAWLDSPATNPPDVKKTVKTGSSAAKTTDLFGGHDLDAFEASQLKSKKSLTKPEDKEGNSSGDHEEEKKKRHSEKRNKDGEEEGKHKHRSKHKHKKKSKTKDTDEDESGEKKSKSKKKHRHKHSKSKEKKESARDGADYESF